jgi:phenylacetate-CoA ligase
MDSAPKGQRLYWNMEIEPKLNTPEMKEIQWRKLKKQLAYFYDKTPFWRSRMDKAGVKPDTITSWDDFYKAIPVLTKEGYRRYAEECGGDIDKILNGLMGDDAKRLVILGATSGTTGEPTPYPFTPEDQKTFTEFVARPLWRGGVYPGDRILHAFGLSMFIGGTIMCMAISNYGACAIPVGAEAGTEAILKYAQMLKPKALVCTPSLAEYMIEKAVEITGKGVDALKLKTIICGGEPGAGIPEVRQKIEGAFKARLHDIGGGGFSCDYPEQGMHFLMDDIMLFELVHPETHEHVPLEDGATGLIVFTQLEGSIGWTGLRQSPNDLMQVFTSPCPCGKTGFRFKIIGRQDDMLKVKGVMVYPAAVVGVINEFVPKVTGEFRIVLDEPPPRVVPPLKLKVEYGEAIKEEQLESLADELTEAMHRRIKIRPKIMWIPPNTLERFLKKKKLFEKTYEK